MFLILGLGTAVSLAGGVYVAPSVDAGPTYGTLYWSTGVQATAGGAVLVSVSERLSIGPSLAISGWNGSFYGGSAEAVGGALALQSRFWRGDDRFLDSTWLALGVDATLYRLHRRWGSQDPDDIAYMTPTVWVPAILAEVGLAHEFAFVVFRVGYPRDGETFFCVESDGCSVGFSGTKYAQSGLGVDVVALVHWMGER
ncbi:MAG TPA: hypothetical protein QGF58_14435 [Myxococcota bacterium]|nr:hypothetical protein [Myxococcota bacterium]